MNQEKIIELQKKFVEIRNAISEKSVSENGDVSVTFNGNLEITSLQFNSQMKYETVNPILISTINKGIKQTSAKIQQAMQALQKDMQ